MEEIFHKKVDSTHPRKKPKQSSELHQTATSAQKKVGSNQAVKTSKYDLKKNKNKPTYPMKGHGHLMNSCKFKKAQAKSMKEN